MAAASDPFTIALLQSACGPDPQANLEKTMGQIRQAAQRGARVVCTQELFRGPYFCQLEDPAFFDLAEPIPGPTTDALAPLARELGVVVVASLFERRAAGLYHNTAAVIDADGALLGRYRKMHIPDDPLYYEKYYFAPGDLGFRTFATRWGKIGVLICWDQWFPEAARLTALQDCAVLFYPTAIGWHTKEKAAEGAAQADAWLTIQRAHAIANGVYVAAANRVGREQIPGAAGEGLEFFGGSFVADPFGRILGQASSHDDEIVLAAIDPQLQEQTRRHWPFLRDRRPEAYAGLSARFHS